MPNLNPKLSIFFSPGIESNLQQKDFQLFAEQIDLWEFPLSSLLRKDASIYLCLEEKERAKRLLSSTHQQRFIQAHDMLRRILALYLHQEPESIEFKKNTQGKPFLQDASGLEFNLSHSQDLAFLAVGKTFPLGVDCEFFSPRPYQSMVAQLFPESLSQAFQALKPNVKALAFFHLWVQKEALIKAHGRSIHDQVEASTLHFFPSNAYIFHDNQAKSWQMHTKMPRINACLALCCHLEIKKIRHIKIAGPEDLAHIPSSRKIG